MSKKSWIIIIVEAMLFLAVLGTVVKCSNDKVERLENNIDAYKTEMEVVKTHNGELIATKQSLILSVEEMREELEISKRELKELEKTLADDVAYIAKLQSQIAVPDTIYMKGDTVYIKDDYTIKVFEWVDDWTKIGAEVTGVSVEDSELSIFNLNVDVPLEFGLTDGYKVFVKSSNPYVRFNELNSVIVNHSSVKEKEKRLHHGILLGFGVHYGLSQSNWDFGPGVMYGLTYSF
jgi:regulator of replication initiation timing